MTVYTIMINNELRFVETDPDTVRKVVSEQADIDLHSMFSDKENNNFVEYTVKVDSWFVA